MKEFVSDPMNMFWYWFVPICVIVIFCIWYDTFGADSRKPKYRLDKDGYVQFYYRRYSWWINFPIWNDNNDERKIEVHDRVRNLDYTLSYVGPGRAKLKLTFDDVNSISEKFITNYVRELHPEFTTSEQLFQLHNIYVDKENNLLSKIVKDRIFK